MARSRPTSSTSPTRRTCRSWISTSGLTCSSPRTPRGRKAAGHFRHMDSLGVELTVLTVGLAHGMLRNTAERAANVLAEVMFYPSGDFSPATGQALALDTAYVRAILEGSS